MQNYKKDEVNAMKKKSCYAILLISVITISGCGTNTGIDQTSSVESESASADTETETSGWLDASDLFSDRDFEVGYDEDESTLIQLNSDSASCDSDAVQITDSTVTISDEGTYILSGTLDDGMIIINAEKTDKIQLVLDGVTIHSETSAPVYILQADKVFLTLASDSENTLSNGGSFEAIDENNIDAVIFSKDDLTLNGSGTLTITSPAGHGVVSKDELTITSGTYQITSASHGLSGKDSVCIANAAFTISSGKDGIHAENTDDTSLGFIYIQSGSFDITADGDGMDASYDMQIEDGTFRITSGGGSVNADSQQTEPTGGFGGGNFEKGDFGKDDFGKDGFGGGGKASDMDSTAPGDGEAPDMDSMAPGSGEAPDMDFDPSENMPDMGGTAPGGEGGMDSTNTTDSTESTDTSTKGLKATKQLIINGGTFTIDSADDSVHSNNSMYICDGTFEIVSGDDAFHADETLTVTDGTIQITGCYEGLEALDLTISGGDITLTATDDGLNAAGGNDESGFGGFRGNDQFGGASSSNGSIIISGGTMHITASGDGIDSNGSLEITDGDITVCGPTQGDTSTLDYDTTAVISGGTFFGTGASGMYQTFNDSRQGLITAILSNQAAETEITITDSDGNVVYTCTPALSFEVVIYSSPDISSGETYTITAGSASEEITAE